MLRAMGWRQCARWLAALESDPQQLGTEGPQVLGELQEYMRVLEKTMQAGLRWHLAVSWR